jgi:hypothetical protein
VWWGTRRAPTAVVGQIVQRERDLGAAGAAMSQFLPQSSSTPPISNSPSAPVFLAALMLCRQPRNRACQRGQKQNPVGSSGVFRSFTLPLVPYARQGCSSGNIQSSSGDLKCSHDQFLTILPATSPTVILITEIARHIAFFSRHTVTSPPAIVFLWML